ncbi:MAG: hypothetical protein ACI3YK_07180 [Eubacteriales bacterium]
MKNTLKTLLICTLATALLVSCNRQTGEEETTTSATTQNADTTAPSSNPTTPDSTEVKTPEEIYAEILASQNNLKYEITNVAEGITVSILTSIDGNKAYMVTSYDFLGMSQTEETYFVEEEGDANRYSYYYQEDGSWYKYSYEESEDTEGNTSMFTSDFEDLEDFFKSENFGEFDSTTNRYLINEGVVVEETAILSGYLEIADDSYTIEFVISEEGYEMTTKTVFSDFGKVSITLPEAEEIDPGEGFIPVEYPETAPSPEEISAQIETAENVSIDLYSAVGEDSVSMYLEQDRNLIWVITGVYSGNVGFTDEFYLEKDGDAVYLYRVDENGNWCKEEVTDEDFEYYSADNSVISELLKTENFEEYDPETGEYLLKDGKTVPIEDFGTVTFASIDVGFDGSYFIYLTVESEDSVMEEEYYFSYYDFGSTDIYIPFENAVG